MSLFIRVQVLILTPPLPPHPLQSSTPPEKRGDHKRHREEESDGEKSDGELVVDEVCGRMWEPVSRMCKCSYPLGGQEGKGVGGVCFN